MEKLKVCKKCGGDMCQYCDWCPNCDSYIKHRLICTRPKIIWKEKESRVPNFDLYSYKHKSESYYILHPHEDKECYCDKCNDIIADVGFLYVERVSNYNLNTDFKVLCCNCITDFNSSIVDNSIHDFMVKRNITNSDLKKFIPVYNFNELETTYVIGNNGDNISNIVDMGDIQPQDTVWCRYAGRTDHISEAQYNESLRLFNQREEELGVISDETEFNSMQQLFKAGKVFNDHELDKFINNIKDSSICIDDKSKKKSIESNTDINV